MKPYLYKREITQLNGRPGTPKSVVGILTATVLSIFATISTGHHEVQMITCIGVGCIIVEP